MESKLIRNKFFDYFEKKRHTKVSSSSLIPAQDPTLLFANAGMNQFKDIFLGNEKRTYDKAVTIQKCVRVGGKHNDLDNVGFTRRHLTFFEMMGNFSFGDYFKQEAIKYAWEFLTKELGLPADKLHATVFNTDDESYRIWKDVIGLPESHIHRRSATDNFWQMGDTGPCGPCTEIMFDRGPAYGSDDIDNGERFLEIWNLVFMQYDRQPDGTDNPLHATGVDTGMGLERLALVMQDKDSVFETDLFNNLLQKIEECSGLKYAEQPDEIKAAFHVLADHIRSVTLLIADGVAPSNEGRGYVLRKIIRRAALFAQKLGVPDIFAQLANTFIDDMGAIYPDLITNHNIILTIIRSEIDKFSKNLIRGQQILTSYFKTHQGSQIVSGKEAFKLYDTFGFPIELVIIMADEHGFTVDTEGFSSAMDKQKGLAKGAVKDQVVHVTLPDMITTEFTGYKELETPSIVRALIVSNQLVDSVQAGQTCWVVTQHSPFFIVGGGQVPDQGWIEVKGVQVPIDDLQFIGNAIGVSIKTPVQIRAGDSVISKVNKELRVAAMKNHTATHLLQSALIELFGKQIKQSGSLVHPDYLRFDFTYHRALTTQELNQIEDLVNQKIRDNIPVIIEYTSLKDALSKGALAFFGDKYKPEEVRLVRVGNFSAELCGGTHVARTGDIGTFKITEITALSAGHRRIVALTGLRAIDLYQQVFDDIKTLSHDFKVAREEVVGAVEKQQRYLKETQQQVKQLKQQLIATQIPIWRNQIQQVGSIPFLFLSLDDMSAQDLKDIAQQLNNQVPGFYFFVSTTKNKSLFYALVSDNVTINLQKLSTWLQEKHGLRGGVSKYQIQGGAAQIQDAMKDDVLRWLRANS
jgi:alanyl-tRNA synthetase